MAKMLTPPNMKSSYTNILVKPIYLTFKNSPQEKKHYINFICLQNNQNMPIIHKALLLFCFQYNRIFYK